MDPILSADLFVIKMSAEDSSSFYFYFLSLVIAVGVAIGGGWQGLVAYVNLACYYIFGLPLGFLLGYKFEFGVEVTVFLNHH